MSVFMTRGNLKKTILNKFLQQYSLLLWYGILEKLIVVSTILFFIHFMSYLYCGVCSDRAFYLWCIFIVFLQLRLNSSTWWVTESQKQVLGTAMNSLHNTYRTRKELRIILRRLLLFYYLHHNSQCLIIIFVDWTQLADYWTHDAYYRLSII